MAFGFDTIIKYANHLDRSGHSIAANAIDMACQEGQGRLSSSLEALAGFSLMLDSDGHSEASDAIDSLLKAAAESAVKGRGDLYDYKKHRSQTLFHKLEDEAMTKREPMLDTWSGENPSLLTRYSPDYPGVMLQRIEDGVYQDLLSKKVYDFRNGFISDTGKRYHGGSVSHQTPVSDQYMSSTQIVDSKNLINRPR